MYNRKIIDEIKVNRLWWLQQEHRKFFRKNRKKCSCGSCGNPRRTGLESPKTLKEKNLLLLHQDEINEALLTL